MKLDVIELIKNIEEFEKRLNLALSYSGLRLPQYQAMLFLEKAGRITVSDLGKQQGITRATASVLVAGLKKAGIIDCVDNSADKRSFYLSLSESGLRRLQLAKREVAYVEERLNQLIPQQTIDALNDLSRKLRKHI